MRVIARRVKGVGLAGLTCYDLCNDPCKTKLEVYDAEWRPEGWNIRRYRSLMVVEPFKGLAGGTPVYCLGSLCYKLEYVGPVTGFWDRCSETLATHVVKCGFRRVWTTEGPWVESLRAYLKPFAEVSIGEEHGAYCGDPLHNPFFHEGGATLVYELFEQVGAVDVIVAPGYPPLLQSLNVGFERLEALGLIEERPRVHVVDVGVAIPRWLVDKLDAVEVRVSRRALERGRARLEEMGLRVSEVSAACEAAYQKLVESGEIGYDEKVVIILL